MTYIIYTDGSDLKHTSRRLGIGGILVDPKKNELLGEFSEELDRVAIRMDYETDECSNPFAELVAVHRAFIQFASHFKMGDVIIVRADYQGVRDWMTGKWKANAPYIKKVKGQINDILKNSPWIVEFQWIRGHQSLTTNDAIWNDYVDKLAKGIKR